MLSAKEGPKMVFVRTGESKSGVEAGHAAAVARER